MSPTQRTLKEIRKRGYKAAVAERWLRYAARESEGDDKRQFGFGKRQDLFNIIDIVAINVEETLGIQACSSSFSSHLKKLIEECNQECYDWIICPGRRLELWSWRKVLKERGSKVKIWKPRIYEITLEDLDI